LKKTGTSAVIAKAIRRLPAALRFEQPAVVSHRPAAPGVRLPRSHLGVRIGEKSAFDSGPRLGSLLAVGWVIGQGFSQLEARSAK
jgi:hypothetical protein